MGTCLLQIDGNEAPSLHTTLQRLTSEAMTLVAQLVRTHGKVSGPVMHNANTPGFDEHMHPQPDEAFYARILVSLCSHLLHLGTLCLEVFMQAFCHALWGHAYPRL